MPNNDDFLLGWAIGLFEGEGCIGRHSARGHFFLVLVTTDEDVAQRFLQVVKRGTLVGPIERGKNKPYWKWQAAAVEDVVELLELFLPHLSERRAMRALEALDENRRRLDARQLCRRGLHPRTPGYCRPCKRERQKASA